MKVLCTLQINNLQIDSDKAIRIPAAGRLRTFISAMGNLYTKRNPVYSTAGAIASQDDSQNR